MVSLFLFIDRTQTNRIFFAAFLMKNKIEKTVFYIRLLKTYFQHQRQLI